MDLKKNALLFTCLSTIAMVGCDISSLDLDKCTKGYSSCADGIKEYCVNGVNKTIVCELGCNKEGKDCAQAEGNEIVGENRLNTCSTSELQKCKDDYYKTCAIVKGKPNCYDDTCTRESAPNYQCSVDSTGVTSSFEQCVKADDGTLVSITKTYECSSQQCDKTTSQCVKSVKDEFAPCDDNYISRCESNYVVFCNDNYEVKATSCDKNTCLIIDDDAGCFNGYRENDKCTQLNATKKGCIEDNDGYGYDVTLICQKASDSNTYWTITAADSCTDSCNEDGSACKETTPDNIPNTCIKGTSPAVCGTDGNAWFCGDDGKYYLNGEGICSDANICLVCDNGYGGCTDKTKEEFCKTESSSSTEKPDNIPNTCIKGTSPAVCGTDGNAWFCGDDGYYLNATGTCSGSNKCLVCDNGYGGCTDKTKEEFCKPYDGEVLKACTATSTDKCIGACSADKQTGYYWNNGLKTVDCSANSDCTASDTGYVRCGDATPTD